MESFCWIRSNGIIEVRRSHMWWKLYGEPRVKFYHKPWLIHPKILLSDANTWLLKLIYPCFRLRNGNKCDSSPPHTRKKKNIGEKEPDESSGAHSFITQIDLLLLAKRNWWHFILQLHEYFFLRGLAHSSFISRFPTEMLQMGICSHSDITTRAAARL